MSLRNESNSSDTISIAEKEYTKRISGSVPVYDITSGQPEITNVLSTRVWNLGTQWFEQDYLSGTAGAWGGRAISTYVPAGEWMVHFGGQENSGTGNDEEEIFTYSKKHTVPTGQYLWFKAEYASSTSSSGRVAFKMYAAYTTSTTFPTKDDSAWVQTHLVDTIENFSDPYPGELAFLAGDNEFNASRPRLANISGLALEVQGVAGEGGGGGANVTIGPDAPAGASEGDLWFDDADGSLYVYDGGLAAWVQTNTGGGGGANVTVGTDAPADATEGDLWYDDGTGSLYVYDGGLAAWVQTNGGGGSGQDNWSSGWVNTDGTTSLAARASLTFQHNLGTTNLITQIWAADDAVGTNAFEVKDYWSPYNGSNTPWMVGAGVTNITTTSLTVTIAEDSLGRISSSGDAQEVPITGKYIKVVASAGGSSGSGTGGGFIDAFTHSHSNNQANHAFPNYTTSQKVVVTGITCGDGQWPTSGPSSPVIPAGGSLTWTFNTGNVVINLSTSGVLTTSNTSQMVSETIIFVSRYS